jgi:hypothetical protein
MPAFITVWSWTIIHTCFFNCLTKESFNPTILNLERRIKISTERNLVRKINGRRTTATNFANNNNNNNNNSV